MIPQQHHRLRNKAFTLVEILVVVAIVAILSAIAYSVACRAILASKRTTCIANLHQCSMALLVYLGDHGDDIRNLPSYETAKDVLAQSPTFDPNDNWRKSPKESMPKPMIGSFGYIRGAFNFDDQERWNFWTGTGKDRPILVSIFYAEPQLPKFDGEKPSPAICGDGTKCLFPKGLLRVRQDGSVQNTKSLPPDRLLFTWSEAFSHDDGEVWVKVGSK